MNLRNALATILALAVPYLLFTSHYLSAPPPPPVDLAPYYATIASARTLLAEHGTPVQPAAAPAPAPQRPVRSVAGSVRKDLVIGLAKEIDAKNLAVFAASLRQSTANVDLVLFVDRPSVDATLKTIVERFRVELVQYDPATLEPAQLRAFHASTLRWPLIARELEQRRPHNYRGVLFADVRDTAFQGDPFSNILKEDHVFYGFHGVESRTIGECGWNGGWIRDCFGEAERRKLASKPIVCSGVSIANFDEARLYANQMSEVVSDKQFAACERNGVDQGVHNVLIHENEVKHARIISQKTALVANLQAKVATVDPRSFKVRNPRGDEVSVVHQYDRFPNLAAYYYEAYARNIPGAVPDASACAQYDVRNDVDAFRGRCDLAVSGGAHPADCCVKCAKHPACSAWTLAGSQCYLKTCSAFGPLDRMPGAVSGVKKNR